MASRALSSFFWFSLLGLLAAALNPADGQTRSTIQAQVGSRLETGHPLAFTGKQMVLLRRDGSVKYLTTRADDWSTISQQFQPYSFDKFVQRLSEIYRGYEVSRTQHFVVVHPAGKKGTWLPLFERTFQQFRRNFASIGFKVKTPEFPLVAIVFQTRKEFDAYTRRQKMTPRREFVGYYQYGNNRIVTYDQDLSGNNSATVIHEIVHQVAFNTGVQNRFAKPPTWICEGLAVMYETRGVRERNRYPAFSDRAHAGHLANFRRIQKNGKLSQMLPAILVEDRPFQSDPKNAYSTAWALTFYLTQTQPSEMSNYLHRLSQRENFSSYSKRQRWADFSAHFGSDLNEMEHRMVRYFDAESR